MRASPSYTTPQFHLSFPPSPPPHTHTLIPFPLSSPPPLYSPLPDNLISPSLPHFIPFHGLFHTFLFFSSFPFLPLSLFPFSSLPLPFSPNPSSSSLLFSPLLPLSSLPPLTLPCPPSLVLRPPPAFYYSTENYGGLATYMTRVMSVRKECSIGVSIINVPMHIHSLVFI